MSASHPPASRYNIPTVRKRLASLRPVIPVEVRGQILSYGAGAGIILGIHITPERAECLFSLAIAGFVAWADLWHRCANRRAREEAARRKLEAALIRLEETESAGSPGAASPAEDRPASDAPPA